LLAEIEDNIEINPDISIESCKSLLESIAKNILLRLDVTYSEQQVKKLDVHVLLKHAANQLAEKNTEGEYELISRLTSVVHHIAEIRNARGDISHGRTLPKEVRSTVHFAKTIKSLTDGFASYLLYLFLSIDLQYKEPMQYEDNPDYNNLLDEANPLAGISFSKAFFDQDFVAYEEGLESYKSELDSASV
jgi:hypothetical protein